MDKTSEKGLLCHSFPSNKLILLCHVLENHECKVENGTYMSKYKKPCGLMHCMNYMANHGASKNTLLS